MCPKTGTSAEIYAHRSLPERVERSNRKCTEKYDALADKWAQNWNWFRKCALKLAGKGVVIIEKRGFRREDRNTTLVPCNIRELSVRNALRAYVRSSRAARGHTLWAEQFHARSPFELQNVPVAGQGRVQDNGWRSPLTMLYALLSRSHPIYEVTFSLGHASMT